MGWLGHRHGSGERAPAAARAPGLAHVWRDRLLGLAALVFTLVFVPYCERNHLVADLRDGSRLHVAAGAGWRWIPDVLALFLLGLTLWRWFMPRPWGPAHRRSSLLPLGLLPLTVVVMWLRPVLPPAWVSNLLVLIPVVVATAAALSAAARRTRPWSDRVAFGLLLGGGALAYTATGLYFTQTIGAHSGDEGHYLIQAESLWQDGDLDIHNDILRTLPPDARHDVARAPMHISPYARDGRWYSWHPFGLSLLLAPAVPLGVAVRHVMLGLLAGLGLAGIYATGRRAGAPSGAMAAVTILFGASLYWVVYASRALPEVLGATLVTWLAWACLAFADRPRRAWAAALACACFLPWVHNRFVLLSGVGSGLFLLAMLRARGWRRAFLVPAAGYTALYVAHAAVYALVQFRLFEGGLAQPNVLFNYLPGAFWSFFGGRGLVYGLPLIVWLVSAQAVWFRRGEGRGFAACVLLTLVAVNVVFSTTNHFYAGGACMPGRYMVAVAPLLLPAGALALAGAGRPGRASFAFLGLWSTALLAVVLLELPDLRKHFARPVLPLADVRPLWEDLLQPFWAGGHAEAGAMKKATSVAAAAMWVAAAAMTLRMRRWSPALAALIAVAAGVSMGAHAVNRPPPSSDEDAPRGVAQALMAMDLDHVRVSRRPRPEKPGDLFAAVNYFAGQSDLVRSVAVGQPADVDGLAQETIPVNDWSGRGYRWSTLAAPFSPGQGDRLVEIAGTLEESVVAWFCLRQGTRTLVEIPLRPDRDGSYRHLARIDTRGGRGHLAILMRLEGGPGRATVDALRLAPYHDAFTTGAGLAPGAAPLELAGAK